MKSARTRRILSVLLAGLFLFGLQATVFAAKAAPTPAPAPTPATVDLLLRHLSFRWKFAILQPMH